MVKEGATTCFEAWGKDQKWNTSLCHPWASSPIPILIEHIAGLRPLEPGWKSIQVRPYTGPEVPPYALKLRVASGEIRVRYGGSRLEVNGPEGVPIRIMPSEA
ncbi:hypothetical protein O9H85_33380 [Paenibacillus filicis]|uniref:Alpha-L-rhamnosidase C-terminal domain-containing protein n=1 Tax=Paenibacillus gyeongsangnamensis TaxID=3388067 RepID=A0ABT4QJZ6_9BACL|nr:alpha-L-rhamnosidase C-terminal domain-containing protein [Paenibacillus filicis]MCZ8517160.1 hypothetical protein [Paenibacillus filicis]